MYRDQVERDGVYLYELRVIGVQSATANAAFKRSFTVYRSGGATSILAVQSDYTFKTNASWGLSILNDGDVVVNVVGDDLAPINWVLSLTKTMGF
ncbi:MAG: hypothetical protein ACAH17_00260 [Candidatus Paceibacterota bacterium]